MSGYGIGADYLRAFPTPILAPCWTGDGFDWARADRVEGSLSGGEQAAVELARSLDGVGTTNVFYALGRLDVWHRDRFVVAVGALAHRMVR